MSILLESLDQKNENNQVPNLQSSHFDDEMLGDEWLVRRVKFWQITASVVCVLLIGSWIFFLGYLSKDNSQPTIPAQNVELNNSNRLNADETDLNEPKGSSQIMDPQVSAKTEVSNQGLNPRVKDNIIEKQSPQNNLQAPENGKQQYQPKKRESIKPPISISISTSEKANAEKVKPLTSNAPAILVEELPENLQDEFPSIELGSFVIADEADKSFIILDGSFYKINQVIAPEMILRDINQQFVVVEFHQYLVKIPHQR